MARLRNMARMNVASAPGTGTITLGTAVSGWLSFSQAGIQDGEVVTYFAVDGAAREIGRGTYTASGTTLARTTILRSTNSNAAVTLTDQAQVAISPAAEDWLIETNAQTGTTYTIVGNDLGKLVTFSNSSAVAVTLPPATTSGLFSSGWYFRATNLGVGTVTITPTTSTINGASTLVIQQGASARIVSDGTNYIAQPNPPHSTISAIVEGRLTLSSGSPVADVSNGTTIYYTPYVGNRIALYDGAAWNVRTFSEFSLSLSGLTANTNYDVFIYDNAGTPTIDTLTAWTNATTRATSLVYQNGVLVKSGAATRRYVGTIRTTGTTGQTNDDKLKRFVWNYYNRVVRRMVRKGSSSHTYTTAAYRQMNDDTANQIELVRGVSEDSVFLSCTAAFSNSTANTFAVTTIGLDGTTPLSDMQVANMYTSVSNIANAGFGFVRDQPTAGYHYYVWLQYAQAIGTATWYLSEQGIQSEHLG